MGEANVSVIERWWKLGRHLLFNVPGSWVWESGCKLNEVLVDVAKNVERMHLLTRVLRQRVGGVKVTTLHHDFTSQNTPCPLKGKVIPLAPSHIYTSCSSQRACRLWKRRNDVTWTPYIGGGKNSTTTLTYTADECYCTTVRLIQWPALMGFHWKLYSTFPYPVKIRNHMFSPW